MPTPRRSSRPSTPSSSSSKPILTPIKTNTNTPTHHHHKTADELAAEEAAEILHTPTNLRLRSSGSNGSAGSDLDTGSARALRHRRLNEVREATIETKDREDSRSVSSGKSQEEELRTDDGQDEDENHDALDSIGASVPSGIPLASTAKTDDGNNDDNDNEHITTSPSTALSTGQLFARSQDEDDSSSTSGSDSDSDDDSDEATSTVSGSSSNTSDSEEEDDSDDERMDKLLQAAKAAAIVMQSKSLNGKEKNKDSLKENGDDDVVLQFDEDQKEKKKDAPIPDLSVPKLPKAHLSFTQDGKAQAHTKLPEILQAGPSKRPIEGKKKQIPVPELDDRPYERGLSKREKAAQPRKASTSELWASIPTARSDLLPQMKRDYQALSLANSLDPKRFMKGGSKSDKIPESFAIGTMVDAPRHLQDTTLTKERKYRAGQVVQGLIQDDSTGDYAKRKYGDLQWNRMENGRGKGWKKKTKW